MFKLKSDYKPSGDQPQAIKKIMDNLKNNVKQQVLLGATGTGKTFTMANVINKYQKTTLIMAHNKTLAMQLYLELEQLFPESRVEYFVSNFDFYQPEAYLPSKDMYISNDVKHNKELDMMRLSALNALSTRKDTIVVASVACIYAAQNPLDYKKSFFEIKLNKIIARDKLMIYLAKSGYKRNEVSLDPGAFSAKGDVIKISPGYKSKSYIRIDLFGEEIDGIALVDKLNHKVLQNLSSITIFPAQDYITNNERLNISLDRIKKELIERKKYYDDNNQLLESERITKRTMHDLELLKEFGFCPGIENYSSHLDLREKDETPYTLFDYFPKDYLLIIDESHMTVPQIRAMYNTNKSRKETLIKHGFRLPSSMENRPLNFDEFTQKINKIIYISATPGAYELEEVPKKNVIQQIIRPTGLVDPIVVVKETKGQIDYIIAEILKRRENNERVLITTITKRMSEDLSIFLQQNNIKAAYLHSDLKTLERTAVINDLRRGIFDCIVGVNLLREGLDLPEVSLICILDADKQGFLRNDRSLIQTIGRAARNANGKVILFADTISPAMKVAMDETTRRRNIQLKYNEINNITPKTIKKNITTHTVNGDIIKNIKSKKKNNKNKTATIELIESLERKMLLASKQLNFEEAANLRDIIYELKDGLK